MMECTPESSCCNSVYSLRITPGQHELDYILQIDKTIELYIIYLEYGGRGWGEGLQCVATRETGEGEPLLTIETEVNGDSKSTIEIGKLDFPLWVRCTCRAVTRDFYSALAALVGPVQYIFSSLYTISILFSQSPSKLARQPCWVTRLLVCDSGGNRLQKGGWGGGEGGRRSSPILPSAIPTCHIGLEVAFTSLRPTHERTHHKK